ncbi:matE family protein, partial [Vibrio parahaemolyticus VPTS-2010_2]
NSSHWCSCRAHSWLCCLLWCSS